MFVWAPDRARKFGSRASEWKARLAVLLAFEKGFAADVQHEALLQCVNAFHFAVGRTYTLVVLACVGWVVTRCRVG